VSSVLRREVVGILFPPEDWRIKAAAEGDLVMESGDNSNISRISPKH